MRNLFMRRGTRFTRYGEINHLKFQRTELDNILGVRRRQLPWCRLEAQTGVPLQFVQTAIGKHNLGRVDSRLQIFATARARESASLENVREICGEMQCQGEANRLLAII